MADDDGVHILGSHIRQKSIPIHHTHVVQTSMDLAASPARFFEAHSPPCPRKCRNGQFYAMEEGTGRTTTSDCAS